jgi:hypothetical protein
MLALCVVILLTVTIWFYPSKQDFRVDNSSWNGMATISVRLQASPVKFLADLPSVPQETSLVVIPYTDFTQLELRGLREYVFGGGTLVLADDYGHGNEVLSYLGIKARFIQEPLLDPVSHYKNKWLPRITNFASPPTSSEVKSLVLNHATALSGITESESMALSSNFSFLDMNHNSAWDEGELRGPLPVAARLKVGQGWLVLIADPSIVINSMLDIGDNYEFVKNILHFQVAEPTILLDQSHLPMTSLDSSKMMLVRTRNTLSTPEGTLGVLFVILALGLIPIWYRRKEHE